LKWFKDQATDWDKGLNEHLHHCKVFKEGDEVGRTLDLSNFNSYDEIYDRLAAMFSVPIPDFKNRLVYQNAEGSTKYVGVEPYRYISTLLHMYSNNRCTLLLFRTCSGCLVGYLRQYVGIGPISCLS
jgi:hypothetical protein